MMPEIDLATLLPGLLPGLIPFVIALVRGRYILGPAALVACILAGQAGEWILSLPVAINFLVTVLVLPGKRRAGQKSAVYKKSNARFYFLLPGVFWILTFTFFPLIYSLYLSFTNARMQNINRGWSFIGLQNYADIFSDLRVGETVVTSVFLSVGSLILTLLLGTFMAWLFNHDVPGLRVFRSILTMPLFAAPIALGFMGLILFNETSGSINYIIRGLGGNGVLWFTDPWSARTAVLLIDVWQWTPFVFIIVLAAMQSIPSELYEAASLDTSSGWMLFQRITLPLIAPALGTVALLRLVETFKILDIPLSMLGGGPGSATQTYSYYIYQTGLRSFDMGYASALAYILVIIAIIISTIYFSRMRARFE
jgi:multiple sugar transport system permease protein